MSGTDCTVLAFDYGTRRVGVAVGQTISRTARPLAVVDVREGRPDWPAIERLIEDWAPARLVLGTPATADGTASTLEGDLERFARRLNGRFGLPVERIDEHLSSVEADARRARGEGAPRDAVAAAVILESWLARLETGAETCP